MKHSPFLIGAFHIKSVKADDPDYFIIEGYASIYGNIDSYRDIVEPGAFTVDLLENGNERSILWQHNSSEPIGLGLFKDKSEGLGCVIKLPKDDEFVKNRIMPQIKVGSVKGLSIGYYTLEDSYDRENNVNRLIKLKLREVSLVTFPANELAQITAAKQFLGIEETSSSPVNYKMYSLADEKTEWDPDKAIENIKINTNSLDTPSKNYHIGFLKCNPESKSFDDFNMPYVDYINKEFKIIPKAIFAMAADVHKSGNEDLKSFINKIYVKLGKEEPFKSGGKFFVDQATLKNMDKKDLDVIFDSDHVILSTNAKSLVIDSLCSPEKGGSVTKTSDNEFLNFLKDTNKSL